MALAIAVHAKDCYFHHVLPKAFIIYDINHCTGFIYFLHKKTVVSSVLIVC